jgi:hypothetical protein
MQFVHHHNFTQSAGSYAANRTDSDTKYVPAMNSFNNHRGYVQRHSARESLISSIRSHGQLLVAVSSVLITLAVITFIFVVVLVIRRARASKEWLMIMEKGGDVDHDRSIKPSWRRRFLHGMSRKGYFPRQASSTTTRKFRDQVSFKRWNAHERKFTDDILRTNVSQGDATNENSLAPPGSSPAAEVEHTSHYTLSSHFSMDSNLSGPYGPIFSSSRPVGIPPRAKLKNMSPSRWAFTNAAQLEQEIGSVPMPRLQGPSLTRLKPAPPVQSRPITNRYFSSTSSEPITKSYFSATSSESITKSYSSAMSSEIPRFIGPDDDASERPSTGISVAASLPARRGSTTPSNSSEIDKMFAIAHSMEPDQLNQSADIPDTSVLGRPIVQKPRFVHNAI